MRSILISIFAFLACVFTTRAQGPGNLAGQNRNYQVKTQIKVRGITTEAAIPASVSQASQSIIYHDDLGRPLQTVSTQASPSGYDMVGITRYDELGREAIKYLSFSSTENNGRYKSNATSTLQSFYGSPSGTIAYDGSPYTTTVFSASPLNRVQEQGGFGSDLQPVNGKTKKYTYGTNTATEVIKWNITSADNSFTLAMSSTLYPANVLNVSTVVDDSNPDHLQTKVYKDFLGNTVLLKEQINSTDWAETYYVYDKYGRLRIVLPPQVVKLMKDQNITSVDELPAGYELITENRTLTSYTGVSYLYLPGIKVTLPSVTAWSPTFAVKPYNSNASIIGQYAFQYMYDNLGRKIAEKAPGSEWIYYAYNRNDQLVLSQDGNQRARQQWTFVKYDILGRPILSGLVTLTDSPDQIRAAVDNHPVMHEAWGDVAFSYTNNAYPNVSDPNAFLSATYYDDIRKAPGAYSRVDGAITYLPGQTVAEIFETASNKGLVSHTKRRILGTDKWLTTSFFYDRYHRNVFTSMLEESPDYSSSTQYMVANIYQDFTGLLLKQTATAGSDDDGISTQRIFEYDHAGRVTKERFNVMKDGTSNEVVTASYIYNELGQLVDKKIHSIDNGATWLQSMDYLYNIQGAIASVNGLNGNAGETDYFGLDVAYSSTIPNAGNIARYDGLVSAMRWKDDLTANENLYNFNYDGLNRLASANYKKGASGVWGNDNKYSENNLSYDLNGNILSLNRNQGNGSSAADQLTYNYGAGGNQLRKVTDGAPALTIGKGFKDGANGDDDYLYDANGNLIADQNKGIRSITYNHLNLPEQIVTATNTIRFRYDADGKKFSRELFDANGQSLSKTDYIGEFIAENELFHTVSTPHGRAIAPSYANLIYCREANSLEGFTSTSGASLAMYQGAPNEENYLKATSNASSGRHGISSMGGTISVKAGERYSFKVLGHRSVSTNAYLYVKGNVSDLVWTGALLPTSDEWVTSEFVIPSGVTEISVGVLWSSATSGAEIFINRVALYKLNWEHQYFLNDHLGSPRVILGTNPSTLNYNATFESENNPPDDAQFLNIDHDKVVPHALANATPGGNEVIQMNNTYRVGPAKSLKVFPGDKINASVSAYYEGVSSMTRAPFQTMAAALISAMSGTTPVVDGSMSLAYTNSENALPGFGLSPFQGSSRPSAFINYILFDQNYVPKAAQSVPVGDSPNTRHQIQLPEIEVKELGYVFIYLSYDNESTAPVSFDDFKITYKESPVIQVNAYYPYGMAAYSWTRDGEQENKFLYQNKELDTQTGWHDFGSRQYYADLGRWFSVDPQNQFGSPYLAMGNNPVSMVDPNGEIAVETVGAIIAVAGVLYSGVSSGIKAHNAGGSFFMDGFIPNFMLSAGAAMASAGVGSAFGTASTSSFSFAREAGRAVAHGVVDAGFTEIRGGNAWTGFATGFASSFVGSGLNNAPGAVQVAGAAVMGGITSEVSGGEFMDGFVYAAIMSSANHLAHRYGEQGGEQGDAAETDPKEKKSSGGNAIGLAGNVTAGGGFNFSIGLVSDHNNDYSFFFSLGPSIGLDASIGLFSKGIYQVSSKEGFSVSDYGGYGKSHNVGTGWIDFSLGGNNSKNTFLSPSYKTYYEVGGGTSVGSPLSYTYQFSYTWLFGGNQ